MRQFAVTIVLAFSACTEAREEGPPTVVDQRRVDKLADIAAKEFQEFDMRVSKPQTDEPLLPGTDFDGTMLGKSGQLLRPSDTMPGFRPLHPHWNHHRSALAKARHVVPALRHLQPAGTRGAILTAAAEASGRSISDALRISLEMKKEMLSSEFQGSSEDKLVSVVFGGSLVPLKCEVAQAAMDLDHASFARRVTEAMQDAHKKSASATKSTMTEITSKLGLPPPADLDECNVDSAKQEIACKLQAEILGLEYAASSEDQTVGVIFNGNLVPLKCDISEAAMKLGHEAMSDNILEAMAGAYGRAVNGMGALMGVVPPVTPEQPLVFERS